METSVITLTSIFAALIITGDARFQKPEWKATPPPWDIEFKSYITKTMRTYRTWLRENNLDPSPPTNGTFVMQTRKKLDLNCLVTDQFVSNYAGILPLVIPYSSLFHDHIFAFFRYSYYQPYKLHGTFQCNVLVNAISYPELTEDIEFTGTGSFEFVVETAVEYLTVYPIITNDYKFNLTNVDMDYGLYVVDTYKFKFTNVNYSCEQAADYEEDMQMVFGVEYDGWLLSGGDYSYLNPVTSLLQRFVVEKMENLDLRDVIGEENLPGPEITTTDTPLPYVF